MFFPVCSFRILAFWGFDVRNITGGWGGCQQLISNLQHKLSLQTTHTTYPTSRHYTVSTKFASVVLFLASASLVYMDGAQTCFFVCFSFARVQKTRLAFSSCYSAWQRRMKTVFDISDHRLARPVQYPIAAVHRISAPNRVSFVRLATCHGMGGTSRRRPAWCQLAQRAGGHSFDMMMMFTTLFSSRRK